MSESRDYGAAGYDGPVGPSGQRPIITSVRVIPAGGHEEVHIWNRGGKAGVLVVDAGDGDWIASRLLGMPVAAQGGEG